MTAASVVGSVVSLWRYPVKSMMGEELNATEIGEQGIVGDRAYALIESATGKVVSAKNPRKWAKLFDFHAAFTNSPTTSHIPPVEITLPDGTKLSSEQENTNERLSSILGREVKLESTAPPQPSLEEYWLDMEGLPHRETVTNEKIPAGTFFDLATVHLLTTATIEHLQELTPSGRFEIRRFRPNIEIASTTSNNFIENNWINRTLAIGEEVQIKITSFCPRCVMTTLPQGDLPNDPSILKTAVQHNDGNVGVYASVVQGGTIRCGDLLQILD
ncbi:MOSC domain-containing protein [Gloeocapsopsis dulcis]|uniref:MOSC domain-containing protein n=1 Tax=Gloeocapsopsis dulcis AAB1 = 1H9 TaxID=1433147 RepID=A0A6N8FWY7_9CHRO|nr:MOSC N-terminal beta barrel domain-containing protein [Gloeocapsopsis dulcis]MUL36825.1 MOSC domain-containing protein [Gloeocapsopsis dulcis AAB1 = 1H9]WNN88568.1 MOSC domain-containing protein [Gloeocapsopsis dulcis]